MLQTAHPTPRNAPPFPELYKRVERHIPPFEWSILADDIAAIIKLKKERNAVVLAHNYQTPDIFHTVGDIVGDSLALAREAARTDADVIVLAGVHFMAETAKLLNPAKTVLIPDLEAGCSLAASITAADIKLLRQRHPGVPIVTYVNTSAAVIDSASEQPARRSGISTVFSGFSNLAVSAMKCTPASTMTEASVRAASRASARLSPTMSPTVWKMSGVW